MASSSQDRVRIGIVGAGANTTSRHIPGFKAIDGVELVSVCNRSRASSEAVAGEHGIATVYDNWRELVAADDTNAIMIGTWPYLHCPVTTAALSAGKHVLTEARMAMNADQARTMLAASYRHPELVTQIVPSPFTLGVDRTIQRLIGEGFLGDVLAVEIRAGGDFIDPDAPLHWRHDRTLSGNNVMAMGIWYEALLRWVGPATSIAAMGRTFVPMRRDAGMVLRATDIPDHIDVLGTLACGAQLRLQISSVAGHGDTGATLFGSDATLQFRDGALFGGTRKAKELTPIDIPANEVGGWRVEEEFIAAVRGQEQVSHTSFADGVKYMEFTDAVRASMLEQRTVAL